MYTDNDQTDLGTEGLLDPVEDSQEESLQWLLDMDLVTMGIEFRFGGGD